MVGQQARPHRDRPAGHRCAQCAQADYVRAVFRGYPPPRTEAEIDRTVQVRLFRQRRLIEDPPLELVVVSEPIPRCAASIRFTGFGQTAVQGSHHARRSRSAAAFDDDTTSAYAVWY
ncbi:MAG: Scr1 family TA system antitoxin-like transcriptional regulator [Pseudonocardiaceae bacterium]